MARLTQIPNTPNRSVSNPDSLTDLTRLLARLQQSILHADAEREHRLRTSEYERSKARTNIQYARTLLTKLEQDALAIKIHSNRQAVQADLNQKREVYAQLEERLREIEDISIDSDEEDDSDEGEDLLGNITHTPSQSSDSRSGEHAGDGREREEGWGEQEEEEEHNNESTVLPGSVPSAVAHVSSRPTQTVTAPETLSTPAPQSQARAAQRAATESVSAAPRDTTISSPRLRARGSAAHNHNNKNKNTPGLAGKDDNNTASTSALPRSQLFSESPRAPTAITTTTTSTMTTTTATAEAILDHHRAEQDQLTESMVSMARALKQSTHAFSTALQQDRDVLEGAGKGLDRNEQGLERVAGRMGTLRRLTEGEGWWGRMMLYAWIAGLALFAVLLVFVFPKLRF
ncbi:hypothetical protein F5Y17DRAFT_97955 [Xylariaceae sp. FL0594]|nr:hypothetical protein F5Y17DRAFT_97955 [Xylariaceae sp. FL0594]